MFFLDFLYLVSLSWLHAHFPRNAGGGLQLFSEAFEVTAGRGCRKRQTSLFLTLSSITDNHPPRPRALPRFLCVLLISVLDKRLELIFFQGHGARKSRQLPSAPTTHRERKMNLKSHCTLHCTRQPHCPLMRHEKSARRMTLWLRNVSIPELNKTGHSPQKCILYFVPTAFLLFPVFTWLITNQWLVWLHSAPPTPLHLLVQIHRNNLQNHHCVYSTWNECRCPQERGVHWMVVWVGKRCESHATARTVTKYQAIYTSMHELVRAKNSPAHKVR